MTQGFSTVLVTGASGFIAEHCILQLLQQGYAVRGVVRTPSSADNVKQTLAKHVDSEGKLEFAHADLLYDEGWDEAVAGCKYILHVASPYPPGPPKHEDDLIIPARDGTLRVLRAAASAGVKRVVLTSSLAAVVPGHDDKKTLDEDDWSDIEKDIGAYQKSKTLAERAAWDFVAQLDSEHAFELVVINPGLVLGPVLSKKGAGTSGELIRKLMRREYPGCSDLYFHIVDVRDVASAHLAAMTTPEAAGQRFCCMSEILRMQQIALLLDKHFAARGYRIPTRMLPNIIVRLVALFDQTTRLVVNDIGLRRDVSTERIRRVLNWQPRSAEEATLDQAESMIEYGIV